MRVLSEMMFFGVAGCGANGGEKRGRWMLSPALNEESGEAGLAVSKENPVRLCNRHGAFWRKLSGPTYLMSRVT